MRIMIVPGIPNIMEKIPAHSTKMKMVNPAISIGVKLFAPLETGRFNFFKCEHNGTRDKYG
jgi:hypothetical protein